MATVVQKLRPSDHGRPITDDELRVSEFEGGYKYEVIDGRLYVSYEPDPPADIIEKWLYDEVRAYSKQRPDIINYMTDKARIFIPGRKRTTIPEPDFAAYNDFPLHLPRAQIRWQNTSPFLVGEVLSADDPDKDLIRNVALFLQVPSIKEYWVLDPLEDPDRPTLLVYRRRGNRWQSVIEIAYGKTYATKILPGFESLVDPPR
jgi:Uma2 family endonuclease